MAFLTLERRHVFIDILLEFSVRYEYSLTSRCDFLNQTFITTTSGLDKRVTSNENTLKHGIYLLNFDRMQINGSGQGERTEQGERTRQGEWMGRKRGWARRVDEAGRLEKAGTVEE